MYIGNSKGEPVQLVTEANSTEIIKTVIEEVSGGGGSAIDVPYLGNLAYGSVVEWAAYSWIVTNKTSTECYLTMLDIYKNCTWNKLPTECANLANKLTEEQRACLKSITAGNTSGKVFVATKDHMEGGLKYFNGRERRKLSSHYWTSTQYNSTDAHCINGTSGDIMASNDYTNKNSSRGFRPSVCIDLSLYT